MSNSYLLVDCNNIAWRIHHATKNQFSLTTHIIYSFIGSILYYQSKLGIENVAFCWDFGIPKRKQLLPTYKEKRRTKDEDTKEITEAHRQMDLLRKQILFQLGYMNVFYKKGYEADDIIASICVHNRDMQKVILSSDEDFYQLLDESTSICNPKNGGDLFTVGDFQRKYCLSPDKWWRVKAIGGCKSDRVNGIVGVAEGRALTYLRKELKETSLVYKKIEKGRQEIIAKNKPLVKLPFKGTPRFELRGDELTREKWNVVMDRYGIKRLRSRYPGE